MKKLLLLSYFLLLIPFFLLAQNVGIGTTLPKARLHVTDSTVVFSATGDIPVTPGNTAISGPGRRMMWYPDKAAFRVGYINGNVWDKENVGNYSFASGNHTTASGIASTAMGYVSTASGTNSFAIGEFTTASGDFATAMGSSTIASGYGSTAMGTSTIASGNGSTTMGINTFASGNYSTTMGSGTNASGSFSTAMGVGASASGNISTAIGHTLKSKSYAGLVIGTYNDSTNAANSTAINQNNRLFQIGNGTANNARNAMTVLQNGNTGIGTVVPVARLHVTDSNVVFSATGDIPGITGNTAVSGEGRRMMWYPDKAAFRVGYVNGNVWDKENIGIYSFASGNSTTASGINSTAMGIGTTSSGANSTAMGEFTTASGDFSTAIGSSTTASGYGSTAMGTSTTASGNGSTTMGINTFASGNYSTTMGSGTNASGSFSTAMGVGASASGNISTAIGYILKSKSYAGLVIGTYNDSTNAANSTTINQNNRLFQIGNGTADNARSNAMTVLQNGNVGIGILSPSQKLEVNGNITVQNGKGIIRNTDGTQSKKLSTTVFVNANFAAGQTLTASITWPESFSSEPEAFVGNVTTGAGGWAEVVMTLANVTMTGATLYIYNPRTSPVTPNFNIKIIAIGPQ